MKPTTDVVHVARFLRDFGWVTTQSTVDDEVIEDLATELTPLLAANGARGGLRHLLDLPSVRALSRDDSVRNVAEAALGKRCFAVRGILFDKTPSANWKVIWHQDLTIAVTKRIVAPGFGPWSEKDGVVHVQPPVDVLERMVAVRVHLDDCGPNNGPVRVLSGSHRMGRLSAEHIDEWRSREMPVDCIVDRGGILAFHPLILHASSAATAPGHRRVIHLEYAVDDLPGGLDWYHRVHA